MTSIRTKSIRLLAIANFVALALHILMAVSSQFKWMNDLDVAEVSNLHPTLFTPAGSTFAIWGVIYVALLLMTIYHIVISFLKRPYWQADCTLSGMGAWFIINNLATAAWLYVWTRQQLGLSEIFISVQLISLIVIHSRLGIHKSTSRFSDKLLTQAPLSIYLGWISIATIANTAVYLSSINWQRWGFNAASWTLLMIGAAIFISMFMIFFRNNIIFSIVVLWALWGIIRKQQELPAYHPAIVNAAWIGIAFTGVAILIQAFRMQHHPGEAQESYGEYSPENIP